MEELATYVIEQDRQTFKCGRVMGPGRNEMTKWSVLFSFWTKEHVLQYSYLKVNPYSSWPIWLYQWAGIQGS